MAIKLSLIFSGLLLPPMLIILLTIPYGSCAVTAKFSIKEATIRDIRYAFKQKKLTSKELVEYYIEEIKKYNPVLRGVIEVNPDAMSQAIKADHERESKAPISMFEMHGIPILLKDNIGTKDKLNTTAGSFALLDSVVPRDAGMVTMLRKRGAIILGKASLNEWSSFRSTKAPNGWSARGGFGKNPYVLSANPCGSSSGSAISAAANLATVTIGTQANGSILCPASFNSVVGIKPTVGLTSRAGVVPITPRQDSPGPMGRTVEDSVKVLDAIVGMDRNDPATISASKYIPPGGYTQYLKADGLKGKRIGIVRRPYFDYIQNDSVMTQAFEKHFETMRQKGAVLIDKLEIANIDQILDSNRSGEIGLIYAEFKIALNNYLEGLVASKVRSLRDVIDFNDRNPKLEFLYEYGQDIMLASQATNGIGDKEKAAKANLERLSRDGFEKLIKDNQLDAIVTPGYNISHVLDIGGYPGINVPAGYDKAGVPFGISFGGLKGSEPKLIEIGYAFEEATKIRKPPSFKP